MSIFPKYFTSLYSPSHFTPPPLLLLPHTACCLLWLDVFFAVFVVIIAILIIDTQEYRNSSSSSKAPSHAHRAAVKKRKFIGQPQSVTVSSFLSLLSLYSLRSFFSTLLAILLPLRGKTNPGHLFLLSHCCCSCVCYSSLLFLLYNTIHYCTVFCVVLVNSVCLLLSPSSSFLFSLKPNQIYFPT